jgi:hypothetical protein
MRELMPKMFYEINFSGLYYKNIMTVNDTSRVVRGDAPSCCVTDNHNSSNSGGVIYACS